MITDEERIVELNKAFCIKTFNVCSDVVKNIKEKISKSDYSDCEMAIVLASCRDERSVGIACSFSRDGRFRRIVKDGKILILCFALQRSKLVNIIKEIDRMASADIANSETTPSLVIDFGVMEVFS